MAHQPDRKKRHYTNPDHRPMVPELSGPGDLLDTAVREARRRYDDVNPDQKMKWR